VISYFLSAIPLSSGTAKAAKIESYGKVRQNLRQDLPMVRQEKFKKRETKWIGSKLMMQQS